MRCSLPGGTKIEIKQGNLLEEETDAIVCPANSSCSMRGGVAGAIREYGGDSIEKEAMAKAPVAVGKAVLTAAGKLKAKHVIHAPTMEQPVQRTDADAVRKAVRAALKCADENSLRSISFPGMGTGAGRVPYKVAADAMLGEIKNYLEKEKSGLERISIVAYSKTFYDALIANV